MNTYDNYDNKPTRIIVQEDTGSVLSIKGKGNKVKLKAVSGYSKSDVLAVMKYTGDELIFTFKSWLPDLYPEMKVTLDFSQAHEMYHLLKFIVDNDALCGPEEITDKVNKKPK